MRSLSALVALAAAAQAPRSLAQPPPLATSGQRAPPKHFIVIKRGFSGSTWFSTLLLNFPGMFVLDEAIQTSVIDKFSERQLDSYLTQSLRRPMGQIISPANVEWARQAKQTKSCFDDPKCELQGYGATLAPLFDHQDKVAHGFEGALERVAHSMPGLKIILWIRTNVVKMGLSSHGQKGALVAAGESHGRRLLSSTPSSPVADAKETWKPHDFVTTINSGLDRNKALLDHFTRTQGASTMVVFYEAMQRDTRATMQRIGTFLGVVSPGISTASPSVKKSSDDLRDKIKNFGELEAMLRSGPFKSDCILAQLRATSPTVHALCSRLGASTMPVSHNASVPSARLPLPSMPSARLPLLSMPSARLPLPSTPSARLPLPRAAPGGDKP